MSEQWISVCKKEDIVPDSGVCALVKDRQIAIFCMATEDKLYSIDNYDPIAEANILSRGLVGEKDKLPVVVSPLYKSIFYLDSGKCFDDDSIELSTYPVRFKGEQVEIRI